MYRLDTRGLSECEGRVRMGRETVLVAGQVCDPSDEPDLLGTARLDWLEDL